ncbi:MerR family DNA-binding transcriptional regulator [Roseovarius sp. M141]|uniref:MerR family transcriptional regulator n=1 Tax=Roseovarius sp. M141 TaxID=2583806 RepID=UPI0020CD7125|nr:MerR family DNA-binding transcriptional regulator [Roseovarius sp. M141]MCQ0093843.1 MerR family DNA-binding transcriptional regulator [Roseovarius sp. M141]
MTGETMTIREMCDAFDVTPRTLRFYEAKELLAPIRQVQKRLFTNRDRARLKLILRGKRFGFALEDIRQLLDLYESGDPHNAQLLRTKELAGARLAQMLRQREELDAAIEDLRGNIDWAERLLAEGKPPDSITD